MTSQWKILFFSSKSADSMDCQPLYIVIRQTTREQRLNGTADASKKNIELFANLAGMAIKLPTIFLYSLKNSLLPLFN